MTINHVTPERIAAYLSRTLGETLRREIEDHLSYCESCRKEVASASRFVSKWTPRRSYVRLVAALLAATVVIILIMVAGSREDCTIDTRRDSQ